MKKTAMLITGMFIALGGKCQQRSVIPKVEVIHPTHFSVSRPLSELFIDETKDNGSSEGMENEAPDKDRRKAQVFKYSIADGPQYGDDIRCRQTTMGTRQARTPMANWPGQTGNSTPPDPTGAVGPDRYVQCVNATVFKVWDKATGIAIGSTHSLGALWSPAVSNGGDPIVLYDKYADRWIVTQLGTFGTVFYIAVSTSGDPAGTYYTYSYTSPHFPDYPKYSIWADGYYMTTNYLSNDTLLPKAVFCFERDQMLTGSPTARSICTPYFPGVIDNNFYTAMPADADGLLPPFGTPLPFIAFYENGWAGGSDSLLIWDMSVDWTTSTPTATVSNPVSLIPAPFDASYDSGWRDIPQPNSSSLLDGIGGIIQFRAQWRKWTGYNTMVISLPVKLNANPILRSIRWTELRQDQGTGAWSIFQESTFAPDGYCRWMSSIAMDDEGNIALCYAKSGPTSVVPNVSPSLAYTGRLATDPLNTMTFAETVAVAGSGAMGGIRFGDYAQTSLDPDGLTFWHTGEYVQSNGKRTRVYSFGLSPTLGINHPETLTPGLHAYQVDNLLFVNATHLPSDDLMVLDLFDMNGKQVKSKMVNPVANIISTSFAIGDLATGSYLVRVGKDKTGFQKIIKVVLQ